MLDPQLCYNERFQVLNTLRRGTGKSLVRQKKRQGAQKSTPRVRYRLKSQGFEVSSVLTAITSQEFLKYNTGTGVGGTCTGYYWAS